MMMWQIVCWCFGFCAFNQQEPTDNILTIEKKVKLHHFKHTKVIYCGFCFDAHHFMHEVQGNEGKHKFHEPLLNDLSLLLGQRDTVDISRHQYKAIVSSMVNDGLEKGFVEIYFHKKKYEGKTIFNFEYWDKDVHNHEHKNSNFYRPDSDIYMTEEGDIFFYYTPPNKRTTHQFGK
jgi:hypothetical protein